MAAEPSNVDPRPGEGPGERHGERHGERRREVRYQLQAEVIVKRSSGESLRAAAEDISSSGMRLRFVGLCPLGMDEQITLEVRLPDCPDKPFSAWGIGRVVYIRGGEAGIQLFGGHFDSENAGALP
jgi:c-di-GMP-binding flagellar brake protein YcgR